MVPCCVFSRIFTMRRLSGVPVTTHAQFCSYLAAKAPAHIRVAALPFHGKNTVVYSLGPPEAQAADAPKGTMQARCEEMCDSCADK